MRETIIFKVYRISHIASTPGASKSVHIHQSFWLKKPWFGGDFVWLIRFGILQVVVYIQIYKQVLVFSFKVWKKAATCQSMKYTTTLVFCTTCVVIRLILLDVFVPPPSFLQLSPPQVVYLPGLKDNFLTIKWNVGVLFFFQSVRETVCMGVG